MLFRSLVSDRKRVSIDFPFDSLTQQHMKKECDIDHIMKKYLKTGLIDHVNRFQGDYGDYGSATDYQSALNAVINANDMFSSLPSAIRSKFNNSPSEFLAFVDNPANLDEMYTLGLAIKPDHIDQNINEKALPSTTIEAA